MAIRQIKAIETRYNGYRFRSRLEARWAVFFDALHMPWEYEKEGFELPSGRYLPDFFCWSLGCWIEIKGTYPTGHEVMLCSELAYLEGHAVAIFHGLPTVNKGRLLCDSYNDSGGDSSWRTDIEFAIWDFDFTPYIKSHREGNVCLLTNEANYGQEYIGPLYDGNCNDKRFVAAALSHQCNKDDPCIKSAAIKAKSARFEFGECGATF